MRTIKWVSYAMSSLEHRPCMLHKTDKLPRQGNLWTFHVPSHPSALPSWLSDAFASGWKIHKSEGRKRLTSWLFSLSQRLMAHLSKGSSLRTGLYHLNLLAGFPWAFPVFPLVFEGQCMQLLEWRGFTRLMGNFQEVQTFARVCIEWEGRTMWGLCYEGVLTLRWAEWVDRPVFWEGLI